MKTLSCLRKACLNPRLVAIYLAPIAVAEKSISRTAHQLVRYQQPISRGYLSYPFVVSDVAPETNKL